MYTYKIYIFLKNSFQISIFRVFFLESNKNKQKSISLDTFKLKWNLILILNIF